VETTTELDRQAVIDVVQGYYDSWYEGDPEQMGHALHPKLAKRAPLGVLLDTGAVRDGDPDGFDEDTRETMVEATHRGVGKTRGTSPEDRAIDIEVEDVYGWIASVTVRSPIYHEYLHLVRTSDGWRIANALWQPTLHE
jgi:hypothetical protein